MIYQLVRMPEQLLLMDLFNIVKKKGILMVGGYN